MRGLPLVFNRFCSNAIGEGKWVDTPAASLVDALLQEHRVLVGQHGQVAGNRDRRKPSFHRASLVWRCLR